MNSLIEQKTRLRHGLALRMIVWVIAVSASILAAVLYWNHRNVTAQLESGARDSVVLITEGVAARIDAELGKLQGLADGVANVLEAEHLVVPLDQILALQARILREHPNVLGVAVALEERLRPPGWTQGAPYTYRQGARSETVDLVGYRHSMLQDDWYLLPKYLDRPVWSEPHIKRDGIKRVTYSAPIRLPSPEGPVFAGVVSLDIDLHWLDALLARQPLGEGGYGTILTHSGTFVSHPLEHITFKESFFSIAEERGEQSLRALGKKMLSGTAGVTTWRNWANDETSWLAWHPLHTADWTIAAAVSRSALEAQIFRQTLNVALLGALGLLALLLAVVFIARSITRPVHLLSRAVASLAAGDLDTALPPPQGRDEVARLTGAFSSMRDNLKRHIADLQSSTAARERMQSELKVAHDIQMDLVPKTFPAYPHRPNIDLSAMIVPAREVGGDFYDFFLLGDDRLVIAIGDVSGKGVPAALFMAVTRSLLRAEFRVQSDPGLALMRVNDALAESNDACMFVTLFCAVVNLENGRVDYSNAGHNLPVLQQASGALSWVAAAPGAIAAGVMPGVGYETLSLQLAPQDALLLYTDGVTEAMNPVSALFGDDYLLTCLSAAGRQPCEKTLEVLFQAVQRHADGAEQSDDITLLMFRWLSPPDASSAPPPALWHSEFKPDAPELAAALTRLDDFLDAQQADPQLAHALRFIFEEMATNTVKYGYDDGPSGHHISIRISLANPASIVIEDDGRAFDPVQAPRRPDVSLSVEERPIGGLGIFMVTNMAGHMAYERKEHLNRLTITLPAQAGADSAEN